jgi:drug/metabolite transporter (DMT)-like permease
MFKFSDQKKYDRSWVTLSNYITAVLVSVSLNNSKALNFKDVNLFDIGLGVITGVFFLLSFIFYQISVKKYGAGLSGMYGKIGILVPMLLSIFIWKELPSMIQWIGIFLAIGAILISSIQKNMKTFELHPSLILLFAFGGFGEFFNKVFQQYGDSTHKPIFLFFVFFTALIGSIFLLKKTTKEIRIKSLLTGIGVGIPNIFSSFFLLFALDKLSAVIVFPIYSAGSITLISLGSFVFFKENISLQKWISILAAILAMVLINIV